jgi:hypothetical protein
MVDKFHIIEKKDIPVQCTRPAKSVVDRYCTLGSRP